MQVDYVKADYIKFILNFSKRVNLNRIKIAIMLVNTNKNCSVVYVCGCESILLKS